MQKGDWRRLDLLLLLIALALIVIGEFMIYSAYESSFAGSGQPLGDNLVFRQAVFAVAGLVALLIAAAVDYRVLVALWRWIYLFILTALGITLGLGFTSFGAQSWVDLQAFGVQPSELGKVLMLLVLAFWLGRESRDLESSGPFWISLLLMLPPVALIYVQPDFGTALILMAAWVGMVYLAGVRFRHLLVLGFLGAAALPVLWFQMQPYMRDRIINFFLPSDDPSGASYNITQALISIGSGGFWGKGYRHGTQSQLHFLRVRHTDFIFSVLAEEFGFLGSLLLIVLFAALVFRLLHIAARAPDRLGRILVAGVASMILAQSFINIGMNANLLPVTGLPLPLVSYGGSSLMTTLLALGLAQSVAMRSGQPDSPLL
jgi:rod shape determining protein RodA